MAFENFTETELKSINDMTKRNYENLTSDEVKLLMRWNAEKSRIETLESTEIEHMRELFETKIEQAQTEHEQAMNTLELRKAAAKTRLEMVENGQA